MYRSNTRWCRLILLSTLCALLTSGCGGGDDSLETVYLHVFNAYPGSEALSVYGPAGAIATDLAFGERTEEPVAVDRNLGDDFMLILDGAPQTFNVSVNLFALYPHETGTFLVSQRRADSVETQLIRHVQGTDRACRIAIHNSLAASSGALADFTFIVAWHLTQNPAYDRAAEEAALETLPEDRAQVHNQINQHPYFSLVADDETGRLRFIWLGPEESISFPQFEFGSGTFAAPPPTEEYIACQSVVEQTEDVEVDIDCNENRTYSTSSYGPGDGPISEVIQYRPESLGNSGSDCSVNWRLYSDYGNIFFGEHGHDTPHERVDVEVNFQATDYFFFVLYGRPIDPLIETWAASDDESGGGFGEIGDYPGGL